MKPPDILLIEDDQFDTDWVRRVFAKLNLTHRLTCVGDGVAALEMLLGRGGRPPYRPSLILLDLGLPGMDGLAVLDQLQNHEETREIPVFIVTGSSEDRQLLESYRLGAAAFIVKPLSIEKVTAALNDAGFVWSFTPKPEGRGRRGQGSMMAGGSEQPSSG